MKHYNIKTKTGGISGGKPLEQGSSSERKFQGFEKDSFKFLKELKKNNNKAWKDKNLGRYDELNKRIRFLVKDVGTEYIIEKYKFLETKPIVTKCISRMNKMGVMRGGSNTYYPYLWAAYYWKELPNKSHDVQLFITIHGTFFELGIFFGNQSENIKDKFRDKIRKDPKDFLQEIKKLGNEFRFPRKRTVETHDDEPEKFHSLSEDDLISWLDSENLQICKVYYPNKKKDQVLFRSEFVDQVINDFTKLDSIYTFIREILNPDLLGEQPPVDDFTKRWLSEKTSLSNEEIDEFKSVLSQNKQIIFTGPPGTGKTYVAKHFARYFMENDGYELIQFHPSYNYEDFIEGIKPKIIKENSKGFITYEIADGIFKRFCKKAGDNQDKKFVIIIDEINRGNIPKIFGELLYCLEYRGEKVTLPLSSSFNSGDASFGIPNNVYIIGTMNTADRSIALVDIALRRRFKFCQFKPKREVIQKYYQGETKLDWNDIKIDILDLFDKLNDKIKDQLGRHHQIGHSYFMVKNLHPLEKQKLEQIWKYNINPLIEEYFFNEDKKTKQFKLDALVKELIPKEVTSKRPEES